MRFALLLLFCLVLPLWAQEPIGPRETPPKFAPFAQVETHRIRIENATDGAVQVSSDAGKTWTLVGRVTAPATNSLTGYLASGYAPPGTVSATAVHGLRIRVGDLNSAYPKLVNILPREFAQTPHLFGGQVAGISGIYTNIPTGTAIFRELSPLVGNRVYLDTDGTLTPLPINYVPHPNDLLTIIVQRPVNPLWEVVFENHIGGSVTAVYANGTQQVVTHVIKPVTGIGRFDGTSYSGVGSINTNHTGVITISTAPVTTSTQLEGIGPERRGGFQIQPAFHNSQSDEAGAPQILIIGSPDKKRVPELEGTPPLFCGYFDLAWNAKDPEHSWRAEIQRTNAGAHWLPMPLLIGTLPNALQGVSAVRLIRNDPGDPAWRTAQIAADARAYQAAQIVFVRKGLIPVTRGRITIDSGIRDPRAQYVAFYIDGEFKGLTNTPPYSLTWDTSDGPDGEYGVEARAQDAGGRTISVKRLKYWVDNRHQVARG